MMSKNQSDINWTCMSELAWDVRKNASILGDTKVGACILGIDNNYYVGCNIEQLYRNKDIHAEVNAISNMITMGCKGFKAILIVADRKKFTPCGTCLDWIFQFGGEDCIVASQNSIKGQINYYYASELMPHYPH